MHLYRVALFLALLGFWLVLTHSLHGLNLFMGALLSLISMFISNRYLFRLDFSFKKISLWKILKYLWILSIQILLSAFHSLKAILTFKTDVRIVKIHTKLTHDFSVFILANSITLTPGTITLFREGQNLLVLCLYKLPADNEKAGELIKAPFEALLLEEQS